MADARERAGGADPVDVARLRERHHREAEEAHRGVEDLHRPDAGWQPPEADAQDHRGHGVRQKEEPTEPKSRYSSV